MTNYAPTNATNMTDQRDQLRPPAPPVGADQVPYRRRHRRGTSEAPSHLTRDELRGAIAFLLDEYLGAKAAGEHARAEGARVLYKRAYDMLVSNYEIELLSYRDS